MANLFTRLIDRIRPLEYEPEHEEQVEHDTLIIDGKELTEDDSEEGQ